MQTVLISNLSELHGCRYREVDGDIPSGVIPDYTYISVAKKIRKHFFTQENFELYMDLLKHDHNKR